MNGAGKKKAGSSRKYGLWLAGLLLAALLAAVLLFPQLQGGEIAPVTLLCTLPEVPEQLPSFAAPQLDSEGCIALGMALGEALSIKYDSISYKPDSTMLLGRDTEGSSHLLVIESAAGNFTYSSPKKAGTEWISADRETVLEALEVFDIQIPEGAGFQAEGDGWHSFQLDRQFSDDSLTDGTLRCRLASDGTVRELEQGLTVFSEKTLHESIPAEEALSAAEVTYWEGSQQMQPLQLLSCTLEYACQDNAQFVPVYRFVFFQEDTAQQREVLLPAIGQTE